MPLAQAPSKIVITHNLKKKRQLVSRLKSGVSESAIGKGRITDDQKKLDTLG